MSTQNQAPEIKLADGSIRVSGFRQNGRNGDFLSFTIQRRYTDGEETKFSTSFSGDDLLKLSRLAQKAYDEHKAFVTAEYNNREAA